MTPGSSSKDSEDRETKWYILPDGWKKKVVKSKRAKGKSHDIYLIPPVGNKIRSNNDIIKWVLANRSLPLDPHYVNMLPPINSKGEIDSA